jgi:hypothetical protein
MAQQLGGREREVVVVVGFLTRAWREGRGGEGC